MSDIGVQVSGVQLYGDPDRTRRSTPLLVVADGDARPEASSRIQYAL